MKFIGSARISSRGQVVLPKKVRELLDVKEGDDIIFAQDDEGFLYVTTEIELAIPKRKDTRD